ncbi:putative ATP-dependent helicase [Wickerhamomyces ciferrii]|uniref:ATP-dependent helicase n=1 Tax=Wickerhamomyces ciferrii (strain ATCC 14091 / BCRC 22168 / CBS 111 / JCM 3599 / NBRC 0793 / NRRL Y-1031 F-60-10) TaxID=1206466 RepID=K0KVN7_WICCF|nr:putative ATP-dependent helicase [Wickerhamomyces ciferrii]CCH45549.1 putative ATP-dependent helicase [Wickerhamomyces ciferrii]
MNLHTQISFIDIQHILKYNQLPTIQKKQRKRSFNESNNTTSPSSDLGIDNPSYISLSNTILQGETSVDTHNIDISQPIKIHDVKLSLQNNTITIKTKARTKLKSQIILVLELPSDINNNDIQKLSIESKILNKCHFKQNYFQFELPYLILTLDNNDQGISISIQLSYNIQMLETLYFNIPSNDISTYIKDIIPLISNYSEIEQQNNLPTVSMENFYNMICEKTLEFPEFNKQPFISELDTDLLKFQIKTVHWLLNRENKYYDDDEKTVKLLDKWDKSYEHNDLKILEFLNKLSFGFKIITIGTQKIWYNPYTQNICSHEKLLDFFNNSIKFPPNGFGLLSEEMGLGKTVEIISLILLNQREHHELNQTIWSPELERSITKTKATLIICPDSIIHQWIDELELHSPNLKIYVYQGINKSNKSSLEISKDFSQNDVVITTYSTISREIHNALFNPSSRPKRSKRDTNTMINIDNLDLDDPTIEKEALETIKEMYKTVEKNDGILRDREDYSSPLVMVEFWRIILDEVQMIGTTMSNICKIATLIPRVHSWGVSGTPIKSDLNDLKSLLSFLQIHPFQGSKQNWNQLVSNRYDFIELFKEISFRHTKEMVKQDIQIPKQNKYLLSVPFGPIEQNNYEELYKNFLKDVGLDHEGNPVVPDWEPSQSYYEYMSYWLKKLRRVCCHANILEPQGNNNQIQSLKTMDKVLESMIKQTLDKINYIEREITNSYLEIGQIYEFEKKPGKALEIWSQELPNVLEKLETLRTQSQQGDNESKGADIYIRLTLNLLHRLYYFIASAHYQLYTPPLEELVPGLNLDKSIYEEIDPSLTNPQQGQQQGPPVDESSITVYRVLNQDEQLHQDKEVEYYSLAQDIRRELLSEPIKQVNLFVEKSLNKDFRFEYINDDQLIIGTGFSTQDLEIQSFMTRVQSVLIQLNSQATILNSWIEDTISTIQRPLFDSVTDPSGDEYIGSLDDQEKFINYLDFLQRSIYDRSGLILGKSDSLLVGSFENNNNGDSEFKNKLEMEYPKLNLTVSLRGLIINTKVILSKIPLVEDMKTFAKIIVDLKKIFEIQKENIENSKKIFRNLNDCFNLRINYFKQLQELSDNVKPFDEITHGNLQTTNRETKLFSKIDDLKKELNSINSRIRYLKSLSSSANDQNGNTGSDDEKICSICRYPITIGSLTKCGHQYCKDCLNHWLARHRGCPICKSHITKSDVYNFTYNREEINVRMITEATRGEDDEIFKIYSKIDENSLKEINSIKINNNYGSKINTIIKQVLWLKKQNPQVQIVIYSQWSQLLSIIGQAFNQNGIKFLGSKNSLYKTGSGGKSKIKTDISNFKKDSRITCFLLNAKAEASGLTLINAQHVFICEPFVNSALELQAINRIHRIGQKFETSVWMFSITGSVEESIILLSTRKFQSKMEKFNTENFQKNFSKLVEKNGESVDSKDLWNSFFSSKIDRIV